MFFLCAPNAKIRQPHFREKPSGKAGSPLYSSLTFIKFASQFLVSAAALQSFEQTFEFYPAFQVLLGRSVSGTGSLSQMETEISPSLFLSVCVCLFLSLSHAFPVYKMSSWISREARNLSTRGQVQIYFICITQNMQTDNSAHNLTEILDPSLAFHRLPRSHEAWTEPLC